MSIFFNAAAKPASCAIYQFKASHVVFGAPSRTCFGTGICKVYSIHAAARLNIPCELVQAKLALTKNNLILCVPLENCSPQLIEQQFSGTHFILEEDFPLPSNLTRMIKKAHASVPAGVYPFKKQYDFIWIQLPLMTN